MKRRMIDPDLLREKLEQRKLSTGKLIQIEYAMDESTVEVETEVPGRQRGRWVYEADRQFHWHCSECKQVSGVTCQWYCFCPTCGADMRGDGGAIIFDPLSPEDVLPTNAKPTCGKDACDIGQ